MLIRDPDFFQRKQVGSRVYSASLRAKACFVLRHGVKPLVAVVRRRKDRAWVLPKGKLKPSETPIEWPVFHRAVETLITLRGPDLLRIKGLLNLKGSKGPVVFQAVQHLIHPPVELSAWLDTDHASRVVFITRGVTERQVNDLFAACQALGYVTGE